MKKKTLVPFIVFLLGICLISFIVYKTNAHEEEQKHTTAQLNATTYGERIKNEITNGMEITDVLKQILIVKMESLISLIRLQRILCLTPLKVFSSLPMVL